MASLYARIHSLGGVVLPLRLAGHPHRNLAGHLRLAEAIATTRDLGAKPRVVMIRSRALRPEVRNPRDRSQDATPIPKSAPSTVQVALSTPATTLLHRQDLCR